MAQSMNLFEDVEGFDKMGEDDIAETFRMKYDCKYMMARVDFTVQLFIYDEDTEVPYDSINEVLPSLKQKEEKEILFKAQ